MIYFGKGSYFGEIGVLLTGKRSVSVRSKSNSVIYYINKADLLKLLEMFPDQKNFLVEVAK
jgi:CRP-like cAMP-binding protein